MELPDVLGWEETEALARLGGAGRKVVRLTTEPSRAFSSSACWRVVRLRPLEDNKVEMVVAPAVEESCPDWVPSGGDFFSLRGWDDDVQDSDMGKKI